MQVPQTVQMTYWSHQQFFGSHHSRQIPPLSEGKKHLSKPSSFISYFFQWCLRAPATSIWPTPHLVPESLKWKLASSPHPPPKRKGPFYSIDPCSTSMIFSGKKWGFHLIRFDQTKPLQPLLLDPTLCETRRPNVRSPLGGGILNPFLRNGWRFEGPRCSRETWPRKHQSQLNGMM